jgi:PIN domain
VDGLKNANHRQKGTHRQKGKSVGPLAREAIRWIQDSLESGDGVIGETKQKKLDVKGDDAILAYSLYPLQPRVQADQRALKSRNTALVTLLTNDVNLANKAHANHVQTLSTRKPNAHPVSSESIVRQAIHGVLPVDTTFIRPTEGADTCMLDLSGSPADHLKFLPGLKGSRYATRGNTKERSRIRIDLETGAVVLDGGDEPRSTERRAQGKEVMRNGIEGLDEEDIFDEGIEEVYRGDRNTYADLMASQGQKDFKVGVEEMDWE